MFFLSKKWSHLYCLILAICVLMPAFNVATDLYSAPALILLAFAFFRRDLYGLVFQALRSYWLVLCAVCFALLSFFWADYPGLVVSSWLDQLLIPLLCLLVYCYFSTKLDRDEAVKVVFWVVSLLSFFSLFGLLFPNQGGVVRLFYDNGYYTTYVVIAFSAFLPFVKGWWKLPVYFLLALCFFLTGQRVVWILLPLMFVADMLSSGKVIVSGVRLNYKALLFGGAIFLFSFAVLKHLQSFRPADAFNGAVKPSGLFAYFMANERLYLWKQWFSRGMANPFIGVGFGRDAALAHFSKGGAWPVENLNHAHNMVLNQFVQLGLVGLALLLASYVQLCKSFMNRLDNRFAWSALLILVFFFLRNLTDDYEQRRVMMFYLGMIGLSLGQCLRKPTEER